MHDDEVAVDDETVRRLVAEQFADIAHLPIRRIESTGTVNALFRIGDGYVARLPLRQEWSDDIEREWRWIPWFSRRLTSVLCRFGVGTCCISLLATLCAAALDW